MRYPRGIWRGTFASMPLGSPTLVLKCCVPCLLRFPSAYSPISVRHTHILEARNTSRPSQLHCHPLHYDLLISLFSAMYEMYDALTDDNLALDQSILRESSILNKWQLMSMV
jgi:hypothetical protein